MLPSVIEEGVPGGEFDLAHIKAIHRHLFQDVYRWAGETRTVELSKGGHNFQPVAYIATGIANIHERLVQRKFLAGLKVDAFARQVRRDRGDRQPGRRYPINKAVTSARKLSDFSRSGSRLIVSSAMALIHVSMINAACVRLPTSP